MPAVESRTLLHLPLRELLLNGVLDNRGMLLVGAAYGVLWEAGLFRGVLGSARARRVRARAGARHGADDRGGRRAVACPDRASCSSAIVGLLLLVRVLSMIWSVRAAARVPAVARWATTCGPSTGC